MATAVWPAIPPAELESLEKTALANELEWLLDALQEALRSLKDGFEECAKLLAPVEVGSTLPLSSHRSESVKGIITRVGTRIVKGDIKLRLVTLPPPKGQSVYPLVVSSAPHAPILVLEQLTNARTHINACLDVVDASTWAGDAKDANFISGQLRLLDMNLQEAKSALKGGPEGTTKPWFEDLVDANTFEPPLPPSLSFHLFILDAAVTLELRTLEPAAGSSTDSFSPFSFGHKLAGVLGAVRPQIHDEMDATFTVRGQEVKVKEKIRVEAQDPSLMAAMAKMNALERSVVLARKALDVVMGKDDS